MSFGNASAAFDGSAPRVYSEQEIRSAVTMRAAIDSARQAFSALARGTAESPPPWTLDVTAHDGEVHVKGALLASSPFFAIKTSTGFPGNAQLGLATSSGFSSVFDAPTGALLAVLLDNGYLTELRTGAAGALALDLLTPHDLETVCIIGTGGQARFQLEGILAVRNPRRIILVGRSSARAETFADWTRGITDAAVESSVEIATSVRQADAVITVTHSRSPLISLSDIRAGMHLTAVGSDTVGKRELSPEVISAADHFVADDIDQSTRFGELQGVDPGTLRSAVVTLGAILERTSPGRTRSDDVTIADLSGLGVQDAAIAVAALHALAAND